MSFHCKNVQKNVNTGLRMLRVAIDKENAFPYNTFLLLSGMLQIDANINLKLPKVFHKKCFTQTNMILLEVHFI